MSGSVISTYALVPTERIWAAQYDFYFGTQHVDAPVMLGYRDSMTFDEAVERVASGTPLAMARSYFLEQVILDRRSPN